MPALDVFTTPLPSRARSARRVASLIACVTQSVLLGLRDGFGDVVEEPAELHRPVARDAEHLTGGYGPQTTPCRR